MAVGAARRIWNRARGQVVTVLAAAVLVGAATGAAGAITLTAEDQADVQRIETYLNSIGTMRARFLQVDSSGGNVQGTLFIMRPGRLRFEYDEPSPILIVADGTWVHYHDKELDQTSRALISDTTVDFFTRANLRLSGDITISDFTREDGLISVTIVDTDNPGEGSVTFTFDSNPMNLRQWVVTDPEGAQTLVALLNFETNLQLDRNMFYFTN
ncbi:MAG: outer membrane lipoprotein carrier protein LolA [Alphaproteobacteria bacterium]